MSKTTIELPFCKHMADEDRCPFCMRDIRAEVETLKVELNATEVAFKTYKNGTIYDRTKLREALAIAIEALQLIDMRKEGFEEDLVLCPMIAHDALRDIQKNQAYAQQVEVNGD